MATIKLQPSGAVVLKDGKVACGCCGCLDYLLYPGNLMNVKFNQNDLPDNMQFVDNPSGGDQEYFSLTKINPFFANAYSNTNRSATFYYKTPSETDPDTGQELFSGVAIASGLNYWQWARYIGPSAEYPEEPYGAITGDVGTNYARDWNYLCSEVTPGREDIHFYWMFDLFADTLTVISPTGSQSVTRGNRFQYPPTVNVPNPPMVLEYTPCPERGFSQGYPVLGRYYGGAYSVYFDYIIAYTPPPQGRILISDSCKWKIKTPTGTFEKIGNGNTPLGSYGGGYTVS